MRESAMASLATGEPVRAPDPRAPRRRPPAAAGGPRRRRPRRGRRGGRPPGLRPGHHRPRARRAAPACDRRARPACARGARPRRAAAAGRRGGRPRGRRRRRGDPRGPAGRRAHALVRAHSGLQPGAQRVTVEVEPGRDRRPGAHHPRARRRRRPAARRHARDHTAGAGGRRAQRRGRPDRRPDPAVRDARRDVRRSPHHFHEEDTAFLTAIANVLADAVERRAAEAAIAEISAARGRLVAQAIDAEDRARREHLRGTARRRAAGAARRPQRAVRDAGPRRRRRRDRRRAGAT